MHQLTSLAFLPLFLVATFLHADGQAPLILPADDPEAVETHRIIWPTEPGIRYELMESTDLETWSVVAGFPTEAEALAQQHVFELAGGAEPRFFKVRPLDEQAPEIVGRLPAGDAFGVGRFSSVRITLEDTTGIAEGSIDLEVGQLGTFGTTAPQLTFDSEKGQLLLDLGGDVALGDFGEEVTVSLSIADPLGNSTSYTWSFELETEPVFEDNIFVFGSPDAQRSGQMLRGMSATLAARFGSGPVRMNGSVDPWRLGAVSENQIIVELEGATAPEFRVGMLVTNLSPNNVSEIFYRRIESVEEDLLSGTITLSTSDAFLADFMDASFEISDDAVFLEIDELGNVVRALELDATFTLPSIGAEFSGETLYSDDGVVLSIPEAKALFHPSLKVSLHTSWGSVQRFEAQAIGDIEIACVPQLVVSGSYTKDFEKELWKWSHWIWTAVGWLPVGIELEASISAKAEFSVAASAQMKAGFRQRANMGVAGRYVRDATPAVSWDRWLDINPMERVPFTYTINGEGSASLTLVPQIDVRVYGAAGLYLNTDPRLELSGDATIVDGELTEAGWLLGAYADVNAGLSVIGFETGELPNLPPFRLFTFEWSESYQAQPEATLRITRQPISQSARRGDTVVFNAEAVGTGPLNYQWFHKGTLLPGATSRELRLSNITDGFAGNYYVRIRNANGVLDSSTAALNLVNSGSTGPVPASLVRVSGGTLAMSMGTRTLSTFLIGKHEVTWGEWQTVRTWAAANGYDIGGVGMGCAANHPVHSVNWYDVLKWSNAKSEMEGLTPVYTVSGNTYRTGEPAHTSISQNLSANGYRLPLDAEWEFAARGGNQTNGYTYSGSNDLNAVGWYGENSGNAACNLSSGRGTWPVGAKAPNELGLYDMSGNAWEWCWDQWTSLRRLIRSGTWDGLASHCAVAHAGSTYPNNRHISGGFRLARSSGN